MSAVTRHLSLDEMVEQFKTNFRGALQALADRLGVPKSEVMQFDFDPVQEDDGVTRLYATRMSGGRWVYEKDRGWSELSDPTPTNAA